MTPQQVALYARVSGETQAAAHTIASQVEALHERMPAMDISSSPSMNSSMMATVAIHSSARP
jgi:DNA invertase Pin-like site-specific DNA recombinase